MRDEAQARLQAAAARSDGRRVMVDLRLHGKRPFRFRDDVVHPEAPYDFRQEAKDGDRRAKNLLRED